MTESLLIDCDAVLGTFRKWQAEQEPIEAQLSESLVALSAYQSHLDGWQQQLACEREDLRARREQWARELGDADQSQIRLSELSGELAAARDEITALTTRLQSSEEELRAERERFEHECEAARNTDSEISLFTANELNAARTEIENLTAALNSRAEELCVVREQLEQDRAAAEAHQSRLAEVTNELTIARDKSSALTTMLLSRTEELRTVDVCRAEAAAELDLARIREQELVAALEELRQTGDWEHMQWTEEQQQLSESAADQNEIAEAAQNVNPVSPPRPSERRDSKRVERPGESPIFASVKEQFGKLRQQRAMDRPAPKKAR